MIVGHLGHHPVTIVETLLLLVALVLLFALARMIRRRRRRERWRRVVSETYRRTEYLNRAIQALSGAEPKVDALYMQYLGDVMRARPLGLGIVHLALYRIIVTSERAAREARQIKSSWFQTFMWFVPRQIRAPWLDHLIEDREQMALEGRGALFIAVATILQVTSLLAYHFWDEARDLIRDIVTPFKH